MALLYEQCPSTEKQRKNVMFSTPIKRHRSTILLSCLLLTGNHIHAESSHPNKQPLEPPEYSNNIDDSFTLPPVDTSPLRHDDDSEASITLKAINFTGNTVIKDSELQSLTPSYLNRALSANDLEQLGFIVTQHYVKQGYVNSGAYLPEQDLSNGILEIRIVEGKLTGIEISGNDWLHPDYIRNRLLEDEALNVNTLQERYLMLLSDPLIEQLNGALKPGQSQGESYLDLAVKRAPYYGLSVSGNNYRAPSIGAEQFVANVWARNLTRWGDLVNFSFGISEGSKSYAGGFAIPLNSAGTLFDFQFDFGDSAIIEEPLKNVDIDSEVENFSWAISHPVYKSLDHTLTLGTRFDTRRNQTTLLGQNFPFVLGLDTGKSRVSVLRFFQEYLGRFERHVMAFRSTFNIGIDVLGATTQSDDDLPDSEYFSWLGQYQYAYKLLDNGAQFKLRGNLQLSNEPLLPQERISIGGISTVRGYRQNELVRDQGYSVSVEFHYPIIGDFNSNEHRLVLIPFMDYGSAWNVDGKNENLHSVGIGLNWQPIRYIQADFYYGYDIKKARKKDEHNIQDDGIHFNVTISSF